MRKIGILTCDHVRDHLSAKHGEYPAMFKRLLGGVDTDIEFKTYHVMDGEYPATPDECDGYIISGSRYSVYDQAPWIARLLAYVRELHAAGRKVVGICFGHQLIAHALGGETCKAPQGWGIGKHTSRILQPLPWMQPAASSYAVFVSHQDQVASLPPGAQRLAENPHCPVSMFILDDIFLGIQGHPEFTGDYARDLVLGRGDVYGDELIAKVMPSYDEPVDSKLLAHWINGFLR